MLSFFLWGNLIMSENTDELLHKLKPFLLSSYDSEVTERIMASTGLTFMDSLRAFIFSETYKMLIDDSLRVFDFAPVSIFDMWECERATGDPRTSVYLRWD